MSERGGLATLAERACLRWHDPDELTQDGDLSLGGLVLCMCQTGLIASSWWKVCNIQPWYEGFTPSAGSGEARLTHPDDHPGVVEFWGLIEQISRLDDFLFTLECDPRCRPLARECRDDLALLSVLADWCEDNDRPVAAAEARHLGALVASVLRE